MDYKIFSSNVSGIFKTVRHFYGYSQFQLAVKLHLSRSTVSKIETGAVAISFVTWIKFVKIAKIEDPSCFKTGEFEFFPDVFKSLYKNGSRLAPNFKFDKNQRVISVKDILPTLDQSKLKKALARLHVSEDLFTISNHPLPLDLVSQLPKKSPIKMGLLN